MAKKNVLELWSRFKERLSPTDLKTLTSMLIDSNRGRIDKTQLIASALLLLKNDEFLHRRFTDFLHGKKSQEDEDEETQSDEEGEIRERDPKTEVCVSDKESTTTTKESKRAVGEAIFYGKDQEDEDGKTHSDEEGEIRARDQKTEVSVHDKESTTTTKESKREVGEAMVHDKDREDEDGETHSDEEGEIRARDQKTEVSVRNKESTTPAKESKRKVGEAMVYDKDQEDEKTHQNVTNVFKLEGNRRRILKPEPTMKTRASRRLERVTPSYQTIPEEEQCPVSNKVLNNKYSVMQFNSGSGPKKLSKYEEAMARCEDEMCEIDVLMETMQCAVESAEKVLKEEMEVEDLGVKFYRCIERLYSGDMFEIVREDHKRALPVILDRLKQKVDELTVARESWILKWKKVFEENTAKQRKSTAQGLRKK